jgi:hypothetical protein
MHVLVQSLSLKDQVYKFLPLAPYKSINFIRFIITFALCFIPDIRGLGMR